MASKVFQIQAKDSIVRFGPFPTINAVQNLNLDPRFNEEYYSEMGNINYSSQSRQPETGGSFEVTSTGSLASLLARMNYNYTTQAYSFDPTNVNSNTYTFGEVDMESMIFDLINVKQPGQTFSQASLIPNAQLTGITVHVDSTGSANESFTFEADLQEEYYKPYHDLITMPLTTLTSGTAQVPAAFQATVNSGTYAVMYVLKDNSRFFGNVINGPNVAFANQATWTNNTTITVPTAVFRTTAPFDRVVAVLYKRVPGAFPSVFYPTSARFVRGDRADVWLIMSGTSPADATRLLRCQTCDINIPLRRMKLTEIKRNNDLTTTYYRALDYPIQATGNLTINETTLQQWASLQNKTLNEAAVQSSIDTSNTMNLSEFTGLRLVINYYVAGNDVTPLCIVRINDAAITGFSERQNVGGHAERTVSFTGSDLDIVGNTI